MKGLTMSIPLPFPSTLLTTLRQARHTVVLTGAGISAESGIPTFRDRLAGLWQQQDPLAVATAAGFARDPQQVWSWYAAFQQQILRAQPNPAHTTLAAWAQRVPSFTLVTQNIDGLHQRAGSPHVLELHGSLLRIQCMAAGHVTTSVPMPIPIPTCAVCGSRMRPAVVWFDEPVHTAAFAAAQEASFSCTVFIVIGTSGLVAPAATLPMTARGQGATLVDINVEESVLARRAHYRLRGAAATILPALYAATWNTDVADA